MIKRNQDILNTTPAHHGAFDYQELARLGLSDDEILDFSVNSNPYGPPPGVREAILRVPLDRYPDRNCLALRQRLAEIHTVDWESIVAGNGTAELLQLIAFAFLKRGDKVIISPLTFSEYGRVVQLVGAQSIPWPTSEQEFDDACQQAAMVFLCNPNNPDGMWVPPHKIEEWAHRHSSTLFVIDEAYVNFLETPHSLIGTEYDNILVVRSMTKDYALAGLRLGYMVGDPTLIELIQRLCPAWNVNSLAQAAGIAALNSGSWLRKTVAQLHENKRMLLEELRSKGYSLVPSLVHYFLMDVGLGHAFRERLLPEGIMVRDCASFGLVKHVRIATRTPQDNQRLLDAIRKTFV